VVIRTPDERLRIFVSSTLEELAAERRSVSRAISALHLTPVMFELGARPHPPRDLYRAYLSQSDVFIGLYWQSYGQIAPGTEVSGLEEEFERSRDLPRLLYVKVPAPEREPRLSGLLSRIERETSYRTFQTPSELGRLVRNDLATLLSERFAATRPVTGERPARGLRPLPVATTSLIGRQEAIEEVAGVVGRPNARLVTLTGPGGIGKTRLAMAVGERLHDRFDSGTAFVSLVGVTQSAEVAPAIGRAVGADLAGTDSPLEALVERFGDGRWLLILDNMEQVLGAARDLDELLARCPGLAILTTSLIALRLRAEREYPVPPLPLPADPAAVALEELAAGPAIALFLDRARMVRHDFALTPANAPAVVEICRRLAGLPLAIELAAARSRVLTPDALLRRLAASLDALGTGPVDLPERQQTLRTTVEWSVSLLDEDERSLLETVAVFVDGWSVGAAADVAGLDEDTAFELTEALARHSLVYLEETDHGPRFRMLETIGAFVAERLGARADLADIRRRHADHYRRRAEEADLPIRRGGRREWSGRLEAETGNFAAAVRWYLDNDRAPLPHLFRITTPWVLWPFVGLRFDFMDQARSWVDELLPGAETLEPLARAELLWAAVVVELEASDEPAAVATSERLEPLLDQIDDPYLDAVCRLPIAWSSVLTGDLDRGVRAASESLAKLRGQDEPIWTVVALTTLGSLEMGVGHYDDAARHMSEVRDQAERWDDARLRISSRVSLGTLALLRGRLDGAGALLGEALDLSLASRSTYSLTLSLAAFARLALAEGDPDRAALLAGATDGLRRRAGVRVWSVRREADVVAEIRQALGTDRLDQRLAAGSRLDQDEAVAAARDRPGAGVQAP
jgi:predicted ATPase